MRFTLSDDAISRLRLDPEVKGRPFEGPRIDRGLLGGYTTAETRWARKVLLSGQTLQEVSADELEPVYFYLAVRRELPGLLTAMAFTELAPTDYEIVPHEYVGEQAICLECAMPVRATVHDVPEDTATQY